MIHFRVCEIAPLIRHCADEDLHSSPVTLSVQLFFSVQPAFCSQQSKGKTQCQFPLASKEQQKEFCPSLFSTAVCISWWIYFSFWSDVRMTEIGQARRTELAGTRQKLTGDWWPFCQTTQIGINQLKWINCTYVGLKHFSCEEKHFFKLYKHFFTICKCKQLNGCYV